MATVRRPEDLIPSDPPVTSDRCVSLDRGGPTSQGAPETLSYRGSLVCHRFKTSFIFRTQ